MKNKYPPQPISIIWNDIRSGHKPRGQRMLFILSAGEIVIGGYSDGKFWDGDGQYEIPNEEIESWAYLKLPNFE